MEKQLVSRNAIPVDLLISICSRLPSKSVARFHCVSKQWSSLLRRPDFTDLFLKMSLARPCLLLTFELNGKWLFFSVPQPLNPDHNSSPLVADRHMSFPTEDCSFGISRPVRGFLCSKDRNPMICNPSTGQYITLPELTSRISTRVRTFLGYDPIDKLVKVLRVSEDYRVLTLGTGGELSWRIIGCSKPHCPLPDGICINGVLYYLAACAGFREPFMLVYFDVRLEKFKFLVVDHSIWESTLINCNGKLGAVRPDSIAFFSGRSIGLELRVLDDAENQKWSSHIYLLPPLWRNIVGDTFVNPVGMTGTGEFVFSSNCLADPFYDFYYNVVRNTVVRVEIQLEIVASEGQNIYTFIDHVEDVKLLDMLRSS